MPTTPRHVRLLGATGKLRTATYQSQEHLVVPVTILVEGVIHAANSEEPELVLASEFSEHPSGWNGRPVVGGHPVRNNEFVSANSPEVLETEGFGLLFNTEVGTKKLITEAWINVAKSNSSGPVAQRAVERLKNGEVIEVSVGTFITVEKQSGQHNGKRYAGIWRGIIPDHLAFLDEGDIGACSVEMGCGALRSAKINLISPDGTVRILTTSKEAEVADVPATGEPTPKRSFSERFMDLFGFKTNKDVGLSDSDIRSLLDKKLRESEPGYLGIDSVFQTDEKVVYAVELNNSWQFFQRGFSVSGDGALTLSDEKEEVQPVTRFEPIKAASSEPTAACGCQNKEKIMNKAERINALVKSGRFSESDKTWLETVPEDRLSALEATPVVAEPAKVVEPVKDPAPVVGASAQTREQFLGGLAPDIRETIEEGLRLSESKRTAIITALVATKRCDYTEAELKNMSLSGLERLQKLADVPPPVDFSARVVAVSTSTEAVPEPGDLVGAIRAARGVK
jgi:hypothetical protein